MWWSGVISWLLKPLKSDVLSPTPGTLAWTTSAGKNSLQNIWLKNQWRFCSVRQRAAGFLGIPLKEIYSMMDSLALSSKAEVVSQKVPETGRITELSSFKARAEGMVLSETKSSGRHHCFFVEPSPNSDFRHRWAQNLRCQIYPILVISQKPSLPTMYISPNLF